MEQPRDGARRKKRFSDLVMRTTGIRHTAGGREEPTDPVLYLEGPKDHADESKRHRDLLEKKEAKRSWWNNGPPD